MRHLHGLMKRLCVLLLLLCVCAAGAQAARLPGVRTPSGNIRCFYVPIRSTTHGNLLCDIKHASYTAALQKRCISPPSGLDWHGFELGDSKKASVLCAGGIMYDGRDTPVYVTLAYGTKWHYRSITCISRLAGLTCTNGAGHGLFLSRASYRLW
jgi:hypothetical protein